MLEDLKPNDTIKCHDRTDMLSVMKTLLTLGYGLSVEPKSTLITILSLPTEEVKN